MLSLNSRLGIDKKIELEVLGADHLAIIKLVKSRIIIKDAQKIIETAEQIKLKEPNMKISLICTENICSKSIQLLTDNNIDILIDELKE